MYTDSSSFTMGFMVDNPINQDKVNWFEYRLGLQRITDLYNYGGQWRSTCNSDLSQSLDYLIYSDWVFLSGLTDR